MPRSRFASERAAGLRFGRIWSLAMAAMAVSCSEPAFVVPTAPTSTADTASSTTPSIVSWTFTSTLAPRGVRFFSFTVNQAGTIEATIHSVTDQRGPAAVDIEVGLGMPRGTECSTETVIRTAGSAVAGLTGTYQAGVYCVRVADAGGLTAPIAFQLDLSYPGVPRLRSPCRSTGRPPTAGSTTQLIATATRGDGSTADVTSATNWATSDSTVASIAADGTLTGVAPGTVVVTATYVSVVATRQFTVASNP